MQKTIDKVCSKQLPTISSIVMAQTKWQRMSLRPIPKLEEKWGLVSSRSYYSYVWFSNNPYLSSVTSSCTFILFFCISLILKVLTIDIIKLQNYPYCYKRRFSREKV